MIGVWVIEKALILLAVGQMAAFGLFWFDKTQARERGPRVRETTLLMVSLLGGIGAWLGQHLVHHKTRKEPFRTLLGVVILIHLAGVTALFVFLLA